MLVIFCRGIGFGLITSTTTNKKEEKKGKKEKTKFKIMHQNKMNEK